MDVTTDAKDRDLGDDPALAGACTLGPVLAHQLGSFRDARRGRERYG
jgi:hypothetical protein